MTAHPATPLHSVTHRIQIAHGGELFARSSGAGRPLVFVPGWTFDHTVFDQQSDALADAHRVIVYDPRGTGRSSTTLMGNTYAQHGDDLNALLDALELTDVVLVAWSYGSNAAYAYLRDHGMERVGALAILDESPKPMHDTDDAWGEGTMAELTSYLGMLRNGHAGFMAGYAPTMVSRDLAPDELDALLASSERTEPYVAWSLFADGMLADWREQAAMAAETLPVWNAVREEQATAARDWFARNASRTEVTTYPSHVMFWEFPERFNAELRRFAGTA